MTQDTASFSFDDLEEILKLCNEEPKPHAVKLTVSPAWAKKLREEFTEAPPGTPPELAPLFGIPVVICHWYRPEMYKIDMSDGMYQVWPGLKNKTKRGSNGEET